MPAMTERDACALLKARFEAAGYKIAENQPFDEDGVTFEIDGFDADARVGYEYVTEEAGDSWDVDGDVIAALEDRRAKGEVFILIATEGDAPDAASLETVARTFLERLQKPEAPEKKPKKPAA